ncbi:hypothetical protein D9M70_533610 [compost metagenome]
MAELAGDGSGERQPQRRQAGDDIRLQRRQLVGEFCCQGFFDGETRLVDDQRGQGVLAIRQLPDRQQDLATVFKLRREEIPITASSVETFRREHILPEFMRLHRYCPLLRHQGFERKAMKTPAHCSGSGGFRLYGLPL